MAKPKLKTTNKKKASAKTKTAKASAKTGKVAATKTTAKSKTKAAAKVEESPRYLVLVFCGRQYQSLITTLATDSVKEADQEAKFLVSNSVSEKGDKVDVAVFNTSFPWDDKKGWKFYS
jgi:hypothetical protein